MLSIVSHINSEKAAELLLCVRKELLGTGFYGQDIFFVFLYKCECNEYLVVVFVSVTAASEVASSKTSTSSVGVATQSASGKTKCQNTKWTVSKKTK